ncbi:MAG: DMT family transporter, partial [Rhodospirillales bacterium]|nr:DMT family transporter [Rhodospirillales bacterium]
AFLILAGVLAFARRGDPLPGRLRFACLGLGLLIAGYSFGLLHAIVHIPMALAVLTFYLYPLFVGIGAWLTGHEPMTWPRALQLLVAFAGLSLALDVGGGKLNLLGIALAIGSALLVTLLMLINGRILKGRDSRPASMYMLGMGVAVFWAADLSVGEFPLPTTTIGMAAFVGAGLFYAFSIITLFVAIGMIGPVRVALFMNFEPVTSVMLGIALLGQPMTALQLFGAALVVAAIVWAGWSKVHQPVS